MSARVVYPRFSLEIEGQALAWPDLAPGLEALRVAAHDTLKSWCGPVPHVGEGVGVFWLVPGPAPEHLSVRCEVLDVTWDESGIYPRVTLTVPLGTPNCPTEQRKAVERIARTLKTSGGQ